jgi:two-component system, OmpR family, response regulator QseB
LSGWYGVAWRAGRVMMRVLLLEDHPALREMMTDHLAQRGFAVDPVGCAGDARVALDAVSYDVLILDLGLPDGDGIAILREIRTRTAGGLPILVVTARDALEDRVQGLNAGADDYIVKPFDLLELEARLRAVLRRPGTRDELTLCCGGLAFDPASRQTTVGGVVLDLTRRETDLLEQLLRAAGRVVIKDVLEDRLYSFGEPVTTNAVEAAVSRLRKRLANAAGGVRIETMRGIGYRLVAGDDA